MAMGGLIPYPIRVKRKPTMNTLQWDEEIFEDILEQVKIDYPDIPLIQQVSIASQRFWNFSN